MSVLWIIGVYVFLSYWLIVMILERKGILKRYNISSFGPVLMIRTNRGQKILDLLAEGRFRRIFWRIYGNVGVSLMIIAMIVMLVLLISISLRILFAHSPHVPAAYNKPQNILLIPGLNEFIPLCGWIGLIIALMAHEISHAVLCRAEGVRVKSMGLLVALIPIGGFAEPDSEQLFGKKSTEKGEEKADNGEEEKEKEEKGEEKKEGDGKEKESKTNNDIEREDERESRSKRGRESENESEIKKEKKYKKVATAEERTRILAAGITSNFCIAIISFLLFFAFLSAFKPVSDFAPYIYEVAPGSPAEKAGLSAGMLITAVDGHPVDSIDDLNIRKSHVNLTVIDKDGKIQEIFVDNICKGVYIIDVTEGYPAQRAGIKGGMCITAIDNITHPSFEDFIAFMNRTRPGQTLRIRLCDGGEEKVFVVNLTAAPHGEEKGFLGVIVANIPLGIAVGFPSDAYLESLRYIFLSIFAPKSLEEWFYVWPVILTLPLYPPPEGFNSFYPMLSQFYTLSASLPPAIEDACFFIADVLFWTAWINLQVALFNCLPAIPLDGGHVFREMMKSALFFVKEKRRRERISMVIAGVLSISIFLLIIFTFLRSFLITYH